MVCFQDLDTIASAGLLHNWALIPFYHGQDLLLQLFSECIFGPAIRLSY